MVSTRFRTNSTNEISLVKHTILLFQRTNTTSKIESLKDGQENRKVVIFYYYYVTVTDSTNSTA